MLPTRTRLTFPAKQLRAGVIASWCGAARVKHVVCFTCGNAASALRATGLDTVLEIGPRGELLAGTWWDQATIARYFPGYFDATSGHLPSELMNQLAVTYFNHLAQDLTEAAYDVPTGSGETLVALALAFPHKEFHAVYSSKDASCAYSPRAPLNALVRRLAAGIRTE